MTSKILNQFKVNLNSPIRTALKRAIHFLEFYQFLQKPISKGFFFGNVVKATMGLFFRNTDILKSEHRNDCILLISQVTWIKLLIARYIYGSFTNKYKRFQWRLLNS